jgi:PTH2 family peptidyl-tRNA hydrolase
LLKQAIVVRKDMEWGKGKLAAHVAHAAVESLFKADPEDVKIWRKGGAMKIVLKIPTLKELILISKKVKETKLPFALIRDAGKTQLKAGTVTCLGIGPADQKKIDRITGKLKLL